MNNIYRTPVEVPDLPDNISLAQQYRDRAISLSPSANIVPYNKIIKAKKHLPRLMKRALKLISRTADHSLFNFTMCNVDSPWFTTWNTVAADLLAEQLNEFGFRTRVWAGSSGNVYLDIMW